VVDASGIPATVVSCCGVNWSCLAATVPVPLSVTVWGDPEALSAMLMLSAVVAPAVVGVNVTFIVQLDPGLRLVTPVQVPVGESANGPAGSEMAMFDSTAVPVFESVMVWMGLVLPSWVVKLSVEGASSTSGTAAAVPLPNRLTLCGDPIALSATLRVTVGTLPVAVGVKVTAMVQLALAASVVTPVQVPVFDSANGPLGSVIAMLESVAFPVFARVNDCGALVTPTVLVNVSEAGVSDTCGASPVPFSVASCGELVALSLTDRETGAIGPTWFAWKTTAIVQLCPAARVDVQVPVDPMLKGLVGDT